MVGRCGIVGFAAVVDKKGHAGKACVSGNPCLSVRMRFRRNTGVLCRDCC